MKLIKFLVLALVLVPRTCRCKIIIHTSSHDTLSSRVADDLVNIVVSCHGPKINGVGLAGNLPSTLSRKLSVHHSIPIVLIDNVYTSNDKPFYAEEKFRQKLSVFIIESSSFNELATLIRMNMRSSIWWNNKASYYILDLSPGCVNAPNYLYLAWQYNVLDAKVMCGHHKSERIIFNYNPFTSQAPVSWQRFDVFRGLYRHPFTVFSRQYQENVTMCEDLSFEKTNDLGGYTIGVEGYGLGYVRGSLRDPVYEYFATVDNIFINVFRVLNATMKMTTPPAWYKPVIKDIRKERIGIRPAAMTYPYEVVDHHIVTQVRDRESKSDQILTVIGSDSRIGLAIVCFVTLIVLVVFVHRALVPAFMNLIRVICTTGFINIPDNNVLRIYLAGVCFFTIMIHGVIQAVFGSTLMNQIPVRNAETLEDLVDLGYKHIYCDEWNRVLFTDFDPANVVSRVTRQDCIKHATDNASTACVINMEWDCDRVYELNLHMSERLGMYPGAFQIRQDWPLEKSVNKIIGKLVEASLVEPYDVKFNSTKLRALQNKPVMNNMEFESIKFDQIRFAFEFLGIGLACATIAFIIELILPYKIIWRIRLVNR